MITIVLVVVACLFLLKAIVAFFVLMVGKKQVWGNDQKKQIAAIVMIHKLLIHLITPIIFAIALLLLAILFQK